MEFRFHGYLWTITCKFTSLLTDDEIVEDVRSSFKEADPDVSETPEETEEDEEEAPPTTQEMLKAMATLERGLLSRNFTDCQLLINKFKCSVNKTEDCKRKQSTIDKFLISL